MHAPLLVLLPALPQFFGGTLKLLPLERTVRQLRQRHPQEAAQAERALALAADSAARAALERPPLPRPLSPRLGGAGHAPGAALPLPPPRLPPAPRMGGVGQAPPLPPGEPEPLFAPVVLRHSGGNSDWCLTTAAVRISIPYVEDRAAAMQELRCLVESAGVEGGRLGTRCRLSRGGLLWHTGRHRRRR